MSEQINYQDSPQTEIINSEDETPKDEEQIKPVKIPKEKSPKVFKELEENLDYECLLNMVLDLYDTNDGESFDIIKKASAFLDKEESHNYNVEAAIKTARLIKEKLNGFEPQNEKVVLRAFTDIALRNYFSPEELNAFFSKINYEENSNQKSFAHLEYNELSLNKNTFDGLTPEKIEFQILHEIGHIIDYSHALNPDNEESDEEASENDEFSDLIQEIPIEMQNRYSINISKESEEQGWSEVKANLLAIWARNQNNPNGFFLERLNRTEPGLLKRLFKKKKIFTKKYVEAKEKNDLNFLRGVIGPDNLESFDRLVENSERIFQYLTEKWKNSKELSGENFYEQLQIQDDDFEIDELLDLDTMNMQNNSDSIPEDMASNQKQPKESSGNTPAAPKQTKKSTSIADVAVSVKDIFKACADDFDLFGGK